jgi:hypothetical protein
MVRTELTPQPAAYHRIKLATAASLIIVALDAAAVTAVALAAPARTWVLGLAAAVSLERVAFTARTVPAWPFAEPTLVHIR